MVIGDDNRQYGPVDVQELRQWFREGRVGSDTLVCPDGSGHWQPLGRLNFLDIQKIGERNSAGAVQHKLKPHRGGKILLFGSLGLLCCFPLSILAWIMAKEDLHKMRNGEMDPAGETLTTSGMVLGILATIFLSLSAIMLIGGIIAEAAGR